MKQTHASMQTHIEKKIDNWFLWGEDQVQGYVHSIGRLFLYLCTR